MTTIRERLAEALPGLEMEAQVFDSGDVMVWVWAPHAMIVLETRVDPSGCRPS